MKHCYMSTVERTNEQYHRSHIIIHIDTWHFFECDTKDQLDYMGKTLGFTYKLTEESESVYFGVYRRYDLDREFRDTGFNHLEDLPKEAKPIKALSNGSIVTCYYTNDGETVTLYRPNPNYKDIYKPLPIDQHIAHSRIYGML